MCNPSPVTWSLVEGYSAHYIATSFCRKMMLQGRERGINEIERERVLCFLHFLSDVEKWATDSKDIIRLK